MWWRLLLSITTVLAFTCSGMGGESEAPDLSGTWILNLQKSKLSKKGDHIRSRTLVIARSGSTIVAHFTTRKKDTDNRTETYPADLSEHVISDPINGEEVQKASWEGSTLIVDTSMRLKTPKNPAIYGKKELRWQIRWTLSGDGQELTESRTLDNGTYTYVYDMQ